MTLIALILLNLRSFSLHQLLLFFAQLRGVRGLLGRIIETLILRLVVDRLALVHGVVLLGLLLLLRILLRFLFL